MLIPDNRDMARRYDDPEPYFGPAPSALLEGLATRTDCEVHIVACVHRPVRSPAQIGPNLFYHSLVVGNWGYLRSFYAGCVLAIRRKLRELQPDVVHGQGTEKFAGISAALSGFPNLLTIHGNMRAVARALNARPLSFHWLTARLEALTLRRIGGVICISDYTRREVADLAQRTWLVRNAVDSSFFEVERAPADPPLLVCLANICGYKNQNQLIRSLDALATRHRFQLTFAGHILERETYGREFAGLIAERPWCDHAGYVEGAALKALLARATALILPSLEDNCPMAILEAMAAGLPVAASRIGGIPDLVDDGQTGLLFDPRHPASIAAAVERLLAEPRAAQDMAAAARSQARSEYHPRVIAERHLAIYREMTGSTANERSNS